MNKGVNYSLFYDILLNLREHFHSYGRIDDANAKLDEMIKLISVSYSLAVSGERFSLEYVRNYAETNLGDQDRIAEALSEICKSEMQKTLFKNEDGTNVFGTNPSLVIQPTENDFAQKLIVEIEKIDFVFLIDSHSYSEFDLINECFGHFVRENFRNNKEDAQYMTPYEISKPILDIIFNDMEGKRYFTSKRLKDFTVMDPICGVGTLLIESSAHFTKYIDNSVSNPDDRAAIINRFRKNGIIGQDKVDRMARLSKINGLLLGSNPSNINTGNSIVGTSYINGYAGKVDLIVTNPPFGAEYEREALDLDYFPILRDGSFTTKTFPSELLLLDKCISLLRQGGYLAIVLPDSVFASKGMFSTYRDYLLANYDILGVVGLPSETVAQAGTRTNTCVLLLRKAPPADNGKMFMADCKDIGYIVKERAGVPVKMEQGSNELELVSKKIIDAENDGKILCEKPSVTVIETADYVGNSLKPSFYSAERFNTINCLKRLNFNGFEVKRLKEVVDFVTVGRKSYMVSETVKHISVLHVKANCTIAFDEVDKFVPVSKGRECFPGELIFSKINPRIPRMAVVPAYDSRLVCSNEFEIMRSKGTLGMYVLCFLLKSDSVMKQIENLTAGTSSSHSRIKREQLADILVPIPTNSETKAEMNQIDKRLEKAIQQIYISESEITNSFAALDHI